MPTSAPAENLRGGTRRQRARARAAFPKDRQVIASDGTRLAYTVRAAAAEAVPVVYVNGWTCTDSYWSVIGPMLIDAGHPALFVDLRGHGESGLPRRPGLAARDLHPEDLSPRRLAMDLVEVLDDADIGSAVLVGHSMGVQAIIETCVVAPARVAALVPVAGAFENPVRSFADLAVLDGIYPVAESLMKFMPLEVLRPAVRRLATPARGHRTARLIGLAGPGVRPEHMASHMAHLGDLNLSVLFKMMSQMRRHHTAEDLPRISAPVLILAGRRDYFTPPTVQKRMEELIPGAELVWFPDAGHLLPIEQPAAVAGAILDFLRRRVPAGAPGTGR